MESGHVRHLRLLKMEGERHRNICSLAKNTRQFAFESHQKDVESWTFQKIQFEPD